MGAQENSQIVQKLYAAFGRGDISAILGQVAEDVDWNLPGTAPISGRRRGRGEVAQFFTDMGNALDIQKLDAREFIAQGDRVVALGQERAQVRETGAVYVTEWAHVFTLRGGKIVKIQLFEDTGAQAAAFGEIPAERQAHLGSMSVTDPPL